MHFVINIYFSNYELNCSFVERITDLLGVGTVSDALTYMVQAVAICLSTMMDGAGSVQYLFNLNLLCGTFQRYIFDYLSERINERNSRLCDVLYDAPWHRFSPQLRLQLLMMLRQSQKDQYVQTARLFPFNLRYFAFICHKIYSLYAVLRDFV